jgi:YVTN family beta-propeller protein
VSAFCPNIAATPDGRQVWFTLKDVGKVQVFDALPPFGLLKTLDTGPITNHVNFAYIGAKTVAYVTIGALNVVKVFRTEDFEQVATIPVGKLPHGIWPSGDGTRMYVGLENDDMLIAIDTGTNQVVATSPIGQAPQAIAYVANAVPTGPGTAGLQPLGVAASAVHLSLGPIDKNAAAVPVGAPTSVALFDQGLTQVLEASVSGLEPKSNYILALSRDKSGGGVLQPLSAFITNAAGSAIVNAVGPIRQIVREAPMGDRRYLVIATGTTDAIGPVVQIQMN